MQKESALQFISNQGDLISFSKITFNEDGIACIPHAPLSSSQSFDLSGIRFFVHIHNHENTNSEIEIWGKIGRLPYSAENPAGRKSLLTILQKCQQQEKYRFLVTKEQDIIVAYKGAIKSKITPIKFLTVLYGFVYNALPMSLLIRKYAAR